jgi:DNA-directed RNA polymerase subunit alpha
LLKKVDELEVSVRASNCLRDNDIIYVGDLVQKLVEVVLAKRFEA